jgi:type II secretory pathway pseudopilin PulG
MRMGNLNSASRAGFGILEVLIAAVVLAFMILGLNTLQKGNRESILRVRARDAANVVAQEVIDSIFALGPASVALTPSGPREGVCKSPSNPDGENLDLCRPRVFKGATGDIKMEYEVSVNVAKDNSQIVGKSAASGQPPPDYLTSDYIVATNNPDAISVQRPFAKRVDVTVKWKFKNSNQSINVSTLVK